MLRRYLLVSAGALLGLLMGCAGDVGEDCDEDGGCQDGLYCHLNDPPVCGGPAQAAARTGVCRRQVKEGGACTGQVGECGSWLICERGVCRSSPVRDANQHGPVCL